MKTLALATLVALAVPVLAQAADRTVTSQTVAPAQTQAQAAPRWNGLTVAEITGRLTAAGLTVSPPQTNNDRVYLRVEDGPLRWVLTLYSCTDGACPDMQFTAAFSGVNATPDIVARWNGDRRFVKAFYAAPDAEGEQGQAVAQYDVLLNPLVGPAQLDDPIQVWRSLAADLGRTVTTPAGAAQ